MKRNGLEYLDDETYEARIVRLTNAPKDATHYEGYPKIDWPTTFEPTGLQAGGW